MIKSVHFRRRIVSPRNQHPYTDPPSSTLLNIESSNSKKMVRQPSPAVFRSQELDEYLRSLAPESRIRRWVEDMEAVLKEDMFAGESIPKRQILRFYIDQYGVNNLFRYTLPEAYRSCYTLLNMEGVGVCPLIIDLRSHEEYERIFRYRRM